MLILTEKPSVAKDFADAFSAKKYEDYYKADNLTITFCKGHLFELASPEYYNPEFKNWKLEDLPIIPSEFAYLKIAAAASHTNEVLKLLREAKASNDQIVVATDADREGEVIARIVLNQAGITDISNCSRFWESQALTPDVIKQGLENSRPLSEYNDLANQGFARQKTDWLIGMNFSRFVSIGNPTVFSIGRVQTAVLCEIAKRNFQVKNFVPIPYNELEATVIDDYNTKIKAYLVNPKDNKTGFDLNDSYLTQALNTCRNKQIDSAKFKTTQKIQHPEKLLNLNALQKAAYKLYGYSPEKTLEIAQKLYEEYKVLSYPRTPSRVMGDGNVELFKNKYNLLKTSFPELSGFCDESLLNGNNKHIFNSEQLEAHHALIPLNRLPEDASGEEKNIYNIVVQNFFKNCMPDYIYNEKTIYFTCGTFVFKSTLKEIIQEGFMVTDRCNITTTENDVQEVKQFNENLCRITEVIKLDKKTTSPKEYSIDTLLSFMEKPKGDTQEKLLGLGTPATRADIISKLFKMVYIIEDKKKLYATKKALWLLTQLSKDKELAKIANVNQTTIWENELAQNPELFEKHIIEYIQSCMKPEIKEVYEKESPGVCPLCNSKVLEGKANFYCSSKICDFKIWKNTFGTVFNFEDAKLILCGKTTGIKNCKNKDGKSYKAQIKLGKDNRLELVFQNKKHK